jgi:hypothetical protein
MKKFLITEVEKARILGMHYNAMGKSLVNEEVGDPGTINAAEREQEYVDGGMSYIGLDYYDENRNRKAYYYQCTPSIHSTADDWNKPGNRAGDFTDGEGNFIGTAAQLGLKGDYNTQLKNACQNIYTFYNNYKKTFCANPKNKTKDNYKWLCPQEAPQPQVASAQVKGGVSPETQKQIDGAIRSGFMTKTVDPTTKVVKYVSTGKGAFTIGSMNVNLGKGQDVTRLVIQ